MMDFVVTMKPHPGDKVVSTAEIRMYDSTGMQVEGQFLLEAETAETRLTMPPGGTMEITEHERREVFDAEQKAAVPIGTAEREANIDSPNTPQPRTEGEMRKHEEEFAKEHNKEVDAKRKKEEEDHKKKYGEGVDAKELRMKEEAERKHRQEELARTPQSQRDLRDQGYKADTSKPGESAKTMESGSKSQTADMSKGVDTSGRDTKK
jgi:hypothetical protein